MNQLSDRELVLRLQCGELDALGCLYNRYRHMVFSTAFAITGETEAAKDLLQDVFLRLHRFVDRFDPERPLKPWLYRMTANLSYTWMKRNHRGLSLLKEAAERIFHNFEPISPQELAEEKDDWKQVQLALFDLPWRQRVVVVLYYLNDLSIQEISSSLEVPEGTVKSRLHYGRRALQNSLVLGKMESEKTVPEFGYGSHERLEGAL